MFKLDSFVLYVANIEASKNFYSEIFECEGQVLSPTFVSFSLDTNITVQLKQLDNVSPSADITGGGTELSLVAKSQQALRTLYEQWENKGIQFLQTPTELVFGLTFVAIDPDGHRIRVFAANP
ncbi:VOC family protein [Vibrio sp. Of7-15]|uniref:VOC family protein n=1 Tax=Vibrio sp. Of7-15 TaxID=2724879 RepID=UPI001EF37412|nr:VOC family protein [Vibrio sp. Of7-15]MCG7497306.1 VOC family protein [Vibrio sp. Of7-15]